MGFYAGLAVALVVPFVICFMIYKALFLLTKRDAMSVVSTFVLGAPVAGVVAAGIAWKMPDAVALNVCGGGVVSQAIFFLIATFSSYYLCAVIIGFLRVREYRRTDTKGKTQTNMKKSYSNNSRPR